MNNHTQNKWPYPGSRWWKFDFHTHTPASLDTPWQKAKGTEDEVTPKKWLLRHMEAGIDCVAVTDHNTGEWIDELKLAYEEMRQQAPDGFRDLTLFPGVEISVHGGFHLLAIFDPSVSADTITKLLGSVRYGGTPGDSDEVTKASATDVMKAVLNAGGIPIPAHADQPKGLLCVKPDGNRKCVQDSNTVKQVMTTEGLLAVEWSNAQPSVPTVVEKEAGRLASVLGSDCHSFRGNHIPGSHYTWVKMAKPTLEGLRLALLDGNGVSVRRSDEGDDFEPFQTPTHFITHIEIESARFMGNRKAEQLEFTPYYNALIGGRGTGKSSIVHAMRLAYRRDEELQRLDDKAEPKRQFENFAKPVSGREGDGALRDKTEIRIVLDRDGVMHRLRWRQDGAGVMVEEQHNNGEWQASSSQALTAERFPVRLFSQGQIAAMAGESRQALLDVIDEAAGVGGLHQSFKEARDTYFSKRAKLREMDRKLQGRPEWKRKLADLKRKLEAIAQSGHSGVLRAHQQALRQRKEVNASLEQLRGMPEHIKSLTRDLLLDDWPEGVFDPEKDRNMISWRKQAEQALGEARETLSGTARTLAEKVKNLDEDDHLGEWRRSVRRIETDYQKLQSALAEQGVTDPGQFGHLVQERQQLEDQLKQLEQLQQERHKLDKQIKSQWAEVLTSRKAVTEARQQFVKKTLENNSFVHMEVVGFGFEARNIERSLRDLLDRQDGRLADDIEQIVGDLMPSEGEDREKTLENVKRNLIDIDKKFTGYFHNFLEKRFKKPEFQDHIDCWFPDDDLKIQYNRGGEWADITEGSQGQRSAALLAFLLAFGDEPLVLDQPEDDLDNHLIYDLIVRQIRENKLRRQLIIVTHNPNIVINGDAEMVHALDFRGGQCRGVECGALQEKSVREEVCRIMEGGREAFSRRWARLGREV